MGGGDLAKEVCQALEAGGATVDWLDEPDDEGVRAAVESGRFDVACAASREDAFPLRMALLVRHLDPELPLVVTIFDPAIARQVERAIPHCEVDVDRRHRGPGAGRPVSRFGHRRHPAHRFAVGRPGRGRWRKWSCRQLKARRARALVEAVFAPYDRSSGLLFYGAIGLVAMLLFEWIGSMIVLEQGAIDALYGSTKSLATVGPNSAVDDGPKWFKGAIVASMVLTLLSRGVLHRRAHQPARRLVADRADRAPRRAAARPRGGRRARAGRAAAVPAAARVRRARGGRRHRGRGRERRLRAAGEVAGRDRARGEPGRAAAAVAGAGALPRRGHARWT